MRLRNNRKEVMVFEVNPKDTDDINIKAEDRKGHSRSRVMMFNTHYMPVVSLSQCSGTGEGSTQGSELVEVRARTVLGCGPSHLAQHTAYSRCCTCVTCRSG